MEKSAIQFLKESDAEKCANIKDCNQIIVSVPTRDIMFVLENCEVGEEDKDALMHIECSELKYSGSGNFAQLSAPTVYTTKEQIRGWEDIMRSIIYNELNIPATDIVPLIVSPVELETGAKLI